MKALHSLGPVMPYDDIPLLTRAAWINLRNLGHERGAILDMWVENKRATGLWLNTGTENKYIINMNDDYFIEEGQAPGEGFREDLRYYRQRAAANNPSGWYGGEGYTLEMRPRTEFETFPELGEARFNDDDIGENDDTDDDEFNEDDDDD